MSLPSRALVKDAAGTVLSTPFINVGWVVTANALAQVFMFEIEDKQYADDITIEAYNVVLPVKVLRSVANVKELAERISQAVDRVEHKGEQHVVVE